MDDPYLKIKSIFHIFLVATSVLGQIGHFSLFSFLMVQSRPLSIYKTIH